MANISAIKLPNGTTYNIKDNGALQLTGGQVTGPVTFGSSVSIDEGTVGDLVVNGNASFANNINANTINGVTVGSSPKFTDTVTTISTSGSGNAITAITASNGVLTATKGTTFLTGDSTLNAAKLSGAIPSTVTATTQASTDNSTKIATTAYVTTAIANLPEPMIFKGSVGTNGTITSLPTAAASNEGWTYKVITALSSPAAKVGDTVISNGSSWVVIPSGDEPSGTVTSVAAGTGLNTTSNDTTTDGGTITSSGTIYLTKSGVTAGSYGDSAAQTPGYGSTFKVPYITVDKYGRVTGISEHTVKIPASDNTNTTYTLTNALASHKFTWTFTPSSGSATTTTAELVQGTGITLTDDTSNKKITIANAGVTSITTAAGAHTTKSSATGAVSFNVPTKTSHLTNDSGFITDAGVTGVKGNSESTYRTGQVNLTAANIGAVATSGNETVAGNKTFSGTTSLTAASTYPASQNTIITPNAGAIIQSPIPKYLWHDIIAFCKATTPTYYTTTNGSTWTTATLEKRLFAHMNNWGNQQILNSSIQGSRWVWHGGGFAYSSLSWIILGITYNANIATFDLLLETTADATASSPTWTTLCSVTGAKYNQQPIWIKASGPSSTGDLRLTITRTSGDTTTNVLPICAIEFLTTRWGDQGKGVEFEYPYNWDGVPNIYPIQNNVSDLGSSSNKWANIYATTLNGSLAWSNVSGKPTATGSSATGITASTTATKTTLGTAFSIPNITGVGTASTWVFEEISIPNVTSVGSASTWSFTDVTVPIRADSDTTVPTAASSATACDDITAWSAGSGSYTQGSFSGGSGSFSATVTNHVLSFSHTHTAATHGTDSHTHTAPSLSYTARSITGVSGSTTVRGVKTGTSSTTTASKASGANGSAPTLGTAIKVQSKKSGANSTVPTLGTAFSVPNVTGNTSATVSITDPKHTHTIS